MSSLLACISTKRRTAVRYSSGIQSVASTLPPAGTWASNSGEALVMGQVVVEGGAAASSGPKDRVRGRAGRSRSRSDGLDGSQRRVGIRLGDEVASAAARAGPGHEAIGRGQDAAAVTTGSTAAKAPVRTPSRSWRGSGPRRVAPPGDLVAVARGQSARHPWTKTWPGRCRRRHHGDMCPDERGQQDPGPNMRAPRSPARPSRRLPEASAVRPRSTTGRLASTPRGRRGWPPGCRPRARCRARSSPT